MNVVCHFNRDEISFILAKYVMENVSLPREKVPYNIFSEDVKFIYDTEKKNLHAEVTIKAKKATEEPKNNLQK